MKYCTMRKEILWAEEALSADRLHCTQADSHEPSRNGRKNIGAKNARTGGNDRHLQAVYLTTDALEF